MDLKNKVVIITGGAVRVGREISITLARAGMKLVCHYHGSEGEAQSLKKDVQSAGGTVHLFQGDLSQMTTIKNLVSEAMDHYGRIDALVNNAAIFFKTPFGEVKEKDWDSLHTINLKSPFFLSQEVAKVMLEQKSGKIINIGDAGAVTPFPAYLPYTITKAGIINMTRGLAKALAPHIQVNCVNPGPVMFPEDYSEEERSEALKNTLLKREGSAADIANTVRFLLADSDFITGAAFPVDGGRQAR